MTKKQKKKNGNANKPKPVPAKQTRLGGALRTLGGLGGRVLGGMAGFGDAGAETGSSIAGAISKWLGAGDYSVAQNSIVARTQAGIPMMHNTGQTITVRHKEFIGDVVSGSGTPSAFTNGLTLPLNPGLERSFPWLSTIAQQYQEYTWKGMIFHYVPTSGESVASTNTALGTVMLATSYRATDPAFTNKLEVMNEYFASSAKPSDAFVHPIECDPKENPYNVQYVRSGAVPVGEDQKTYDLGVTRLYTVGAPAPGIYLGELYVTYEIELRKPIARGLNEVTAGYAHYRFTQGVTASSAYLAPLGTVPAPDTLGLTFGANTINFPVTTYGDYIVIWAYTATTGVFTACTAQVNTLTGCTAKSLDIQNTFPALGCVLTAVSSATSVTNMTAVTLNGSTTASIASSGAAPTLSAGSSQLDLYVFQIPAATL